MRRRTSEETAMSNVDIRRQLETELGAASPPPLGSIVSDAVASGRRMRSRNRVLSAIGAGAVVVLAGGGIVGAWMLRPAAPQPSVAQSPPTTAATTVQVGTSGPGIMSEQEILGQ